MRKNGLKKDLQALPREFFHVYIVSKQFTVFLVQFGINLHLRVFKNSSLVQINFTYTFMAKKSANARALVCTAVQIKKN